MELVFVALAALFVIGVALIFFGRKKEDKVEASSDPEPFKQPPIESLPLMTLTQLSEYNGKKKSQVYLACKGIVFDVSASEFYVGDGGYGAFAAKDCSVNLARMSFDEKDYNQYGKTELTLSESDILDSWYDKYCSKYKMVGKIVENKKDN